MKVIKLTNERYSQLLPTNIKDADDSLLSANAKKVLASLMDYRATLNVTAKSNSIIISNENLSKSAKLSGENTLKAVRELCEMQLVKRIIGKRRTKGEKPQASEYELLFENFLKPLKKPDFNDFLTRFMKEKDEFVLTNTNTDSDTNSDTNTDTNIDYVSDSVSDSVSDYVSDNVNDSNNTNNNLPSINSIHVKTIHSQVEKEKDSKEKEGENFKNKVRKELEHCKTEVEVYEVRGRISDELRSKEAVLGRDFNRYSLILKSVTDEKVLELKQENLEEAEAPTSWTESLNK